jgi:hypothetical protein
MKSMLCSLTGIALLWGAVHGETTCAAQSILDACLDTTTAYLSLCASNDYSCLCDKYTAIMTCVLLDSPYFIFPC